MSSPRMELISLLERHRAEPGAEQEMLHRMIAFARDYGDCLSAACAPGHITGSAWVLDAARAAVLLTHHRKLGRWFQLGGHLEPGESVLDGAWREAREESGLAGIVPLDRAIFDIDVHPIPARGTQPEHLHYDVRFVFAADGDAPPRASAESREVAWVPVAAAARWNDSESVLRMVRKTLARWPG